MKIISAWIDDPTLRGALARPILCVEVTEHPDVTIPPENFSGGWSVGKYGPFVSYEGPDEADAGDFNIRFRNRFPVVVDITLFIQGEVTGLNGFSLPLTRARQLTRKYDPDWRLLISDRAAETGSLLWVPQETNPACRRWNDSQKSICGQRPARFIRVADVDLAFCETHVREHNERYAAKRAARTAS